MRKTLVAGTGGVVAALLGSLCCAGPILFATFGVGAGLASTFEPLRPVFGLLMIGVFGLGFYSAYGRGSSPPQIPAGQACELTRNRKKEKIILWSALAVAAVLWTFPTWSTWLV